jgi:peptide/nickel transport system substrate-binding protein
MLFLKRRRLIVWLLKAYIKKWRKTILISFGLGLIVFFLLKFVINYFIPLIPFTHQQTVGIVGTYSVDNLPPVILSKVSRGLVYAGSDDLPHPDLAKSWEIENGGKTYVFHLKDNIYFSDGTKFTSSQINYNFADVSVQRPNPDTIVFNLKSVYSPFLLTVSRPIFKNGFVGIGEYRVQSVNLNGNFVESINLVENNGKGQEISYQFYPTEDALKTAFVLGDVNEIIGVRNLDFDGKSLKDFTNTGIFKSTNYSQLVTLFYNTKDNYLSDKRLREALGYAMLDKFTNGQRNYGPFSPNSWVNKDGLTTYSQDFEHAKLLLSESSASSSAALTIELKTLPAYSGLANQIKNLWAKIGIKTNIVIVDSFPSSFQVFLGEFNVSNDPDQYTLWHSSQPNNITHYVNLRIDKLLEDGRQTVNISDRGKIYADFQKYLLDDPPATFLYFPYEYDVKRNSL